MIHLVVGTDTASNLALWLGELGGFALLILFFATKKFGAKRQSIVSMVNSMLDSRAARIDAQLQMAEESRIEAQKAHEQAQSEIAAARSEADQIVKRAAGMKESMRQELRRSVEDEKIRVIAQAKGVIEAEQNRAVLELRSQAADAAVEAARAVLHERLDESTDANIIERALQGDLSSNGQKAGHA